MLLTYTKAFVLLSYTKAIVSAIVVGAGAGYSNDTGSIAPEVCFNGIAHILAHPKTLDNGGRSVTYVPLLNILKMGHDKMGQPGDDAVLDPEYLFSPTP